MSTAKSSLVLVLGLLSPVLADRANAQTTEARIVGTVHDPSGAPAPKVTVRVRNLATNDSLSGVTSDHGEYVITNLHIGNYEVTVEHTGFKRYVRGPIQLSVEQTARVEIVLEVGQVAETVRVTADSPLIETDQSGIGEVVGEQTIVRLPLDGRNFVDLAYLLPGTVKSDRGAGLSVNGSRTEHNNFMLDGVDNNEAIAGTVAITPSIDALEEFKVQTANYSAEYGRADGAVVNIAIKSGTNKFHGTLFEFVRNDIFDARSFFTNYYGQPKTPLRRNQFGSSLGGPVIKDKLFFFVNFELFLQRQSFTDNAVVPMADIRVGNFSRLRTLYDPMTLDAQGNRTPFPKNQIPGDRIHPASRKLAAALDRWPLPNNPIDPNRFVQNLSNGSDRNQFHIRGDYHLTSRDRIAVRVSRGVVLSESPGISFNDATSERNSESGMASWTRTISPRVINEVRFGATTWIQINGHLYPYEDFAAQLGLPSFGSAWHPGISVAGSNAIAGAQPLWRRENTYQWIDQFTVIAGRHTIKMGLDIRRYQTNNFQPQFWAGSYSFTGAFTSQRGGLVYQNGFGDFLLGLPQSERILNPAYSDAVRLRDTRGAAYVQDDMRISPRLTLNLGLRWERDGSLTELHDRWGYFDPTVAQLVYPISAKVPFKLPYNHRFDENSSMSNPTNKNFAPRVGFAWRPFGNTRSVVRAAYGISYGQSVMLLSLNSIFNLPPFALLSVFNSGTTTPELRFGVFPGVSAEQFIPARPAGFFSFDPFDFRSPYVQQWIFGLEHQISKDIAVKAGYVGTKGTHLERRYQLNPSLPPGPGPVESRRRYLAYGDIQWQETSASSSYHALQLKAEKRANQNLWFIASYTWSKMLDDASSWGNIGSTSQYPQDPTRLFLEKSRSGHDIRQRFSLAFAYSIPLRVSRAWARPFLQGWESSGIISLQTGSPLTPTANNSIPNAQTLTTRANVVGEVNLPPSERTIDRWFNTKALVNPAPFTFGTAGRNIIDGPGDRSFDFSLTKVFRLFERGRLQFRAEAFNFFNHPNFVDPNVSVQSGAFGTIRSVSGSRIMQFALKYTF